MSKLSDKFKNFEKPHPPIAPPKPIQKQDLQPPKPPKEVIEQDFDVYFNKISNSSEFKRLVYLIYTGKTHRGTREDLDVKLKSHQETISIVEEVGRGSHQDFREVVKELKENLAKRKAKFEELN